jgi:hypothetical protein
MQLQYQHHKPIGHAGFLHLARHDAYAKSLAA